MNCCVSLQLRSILLSCAKKYLVVQTTFLWYMPKLLYYDLGWILICVWYMAIKIIELEWKDTSRNPTRGKSRFKVTTTRYFTVKMSLYYLATSFNRQPVSQTATVNASNWTSCIILLYSSRSTYKSSIVTESYISQLKQFLNFIQLASSQLRNTLIYWINMI